MAAARPGMAWGETCAGSAAGRPGRRVVHQQHRTHAHDRAVAQRQLDGRRDAVDRRPVAAAQIHPGVQSPRGVPFDGKVLARHQRVQERQPRLVIRVPPQRDLLFAQNDRRCQLRRVNHVQLGWRRRAARREGRLRLLGRPVSKILLLAHAGGTLAHRRAPVRARDRRPGFVTSAGAAAVSAPRDVPVEAGRPSPREPSGAGLGSSKRRGTGSAPANSGLRWVSQSGKGGTAPATMSMRYFRKSTHCTMSRTPGGTTSLFLATGTHSCLARFMSTTRLGSCIAWMTGLRCESTSVVSAEGVASLSS